MANAKATLGATLRSSIIKALVQGAKDVDLERQRQAVASTASFVDEHMRDVKGIRCRDATESMFEVIRDAMRQVSIDGLTLEFGVATGRTLRLIAEHRTPVHGFDSFNGLPEDWRSGYGAGHFAQEPPQVAGAELHVGWFDSTLPKFLDQHPEPWAFVHLDADLYSSTATVLELAQDRFVPGTVIVFDEFFNYPGWQHHEYRAFNEFLTRYTGGFEYLNYNALHEQVTVRLT